MCKNIYRGRPSEPREAQNDTYYNRCAVEKPRELSQAVWYHHNTKTW